MRLTCREASRLLSDGLDKQLSFADRAALKLHLAFCSACTRVKAQFEFMRRALAAYAGRDDDRR
jgi:anti-sigma factor RsiW